MVSQSENHRRAYLDALGIDLFVPRDEPGHVEVAETGQCGQEEPPAPAESFDALRERVSTCTRCPLHSTRTQAVFGVGNPAADWMIVGEAPGADEDRRGEPFVGRAGKLIYEMMRAIQESSSSVLIDNILKCRPPGKRDPAKEAAP